jgi:hypothetical protein
MKKAKYGIAGVRSGTIFLKPDCIHWNALPHPEGDTFIIREIEVNITSDCTIDEHGIEYSDDR